MQPLEVIMIVSFTSLTLVTALLLIIATMPSRPGLGWWITGAATQSLIYLMAVLFYGKETTSAGSLVFLGMQTTVNYLVAIGTLRFIRKPIDLFFYTTIPIFGFMIVAGFMLNGVTFWAEAVFAVLNAAAFGMTAFAIFTSQNNLKSTKIMGLFSSAACIHWLDYPFLSGHESLLFIGFSLGICLAVGIFLSLSAMALFQFRISTKRSEEKAMFAASHDPLTGLFNRSHLGKLFDSYLSGSKDTGESFLLLYLDLDGFKFVNDNYGHKAGDHILTVVATRMEVWLEKKGDAVRIGGDEIVVLLRLQGQFSSQGAYESARLLLDLIEEPIIDDENTYTISSSIGGCYYQAYVNTPTQDEMMSCADKQMYRAKQAGGRCIFFPETYAVDYSALPERVAATSPTKVTKTKSLTQPEKIIPPKKQYSRRPLESV